MGEIGFSRGPGDVELGGEGPNRIESAAGVGTTVEISFPGARAEALPATS